MLYYLLVIINSKLISWYHHKKSPKAQKSLFPKVLVSDLKSLPIRELDFNKSKDNFHHSQLTRFVKNMLNLHKQLSKTKLPQSKTTLKRQIEATDREIDRLVYELYDLTDEEIKIIEESFKK